MHLQTWRPDLVYVVLAFVGAGCTSHKADPDVEFVHPKIPAMQMAIEAEQKRLDAEGAIHVHHSVSISPTNDDGFTWSDLSVDGHGFTLTYSTRSVDRADTATVVEIVDRPDRPREVNDRLFVWEHGEWVSQGEWFERHHPGTSAALGRLFEPLGRLTRPETEPTTTAPTR